MRVDETTRYNADRTWSDRFLPEVQKVAGQFLLRPSTFLEDTERAADLAVLRSSGITLAVRIRRYGFGDKYPGQFTLRSSSGSESEIHKVLRGFCDWLFYGHANEDHTALKSWQIVDLAALRFHLIVGPSKVRRTTHNNVDGSSFIAFQTDAKLVPPLLIARSA